MVQREEEDLNGMFEDVESLLLRDLIPEAKQRLLQHGCRMQELETGKTLLLFPVGTKRQRLWPTTLSERFRILLPDGQELRQVFDRAQEGNQLLLVLPSETGASGSRNEVKPV